MTSQVTWFPVPQAPPPPPSHLPLKVDLLLKGNKSEFIPFNPLMPSGLFYGMSGWFLIIPCLIDIPVFNYVDTDQTLRSAATDLGLHCLSIPFYGTLGINGLRINPNSEGNLHVILIVASAESVAIPLNPFMPNRLFYINSLDRSISNRKGIWLFLLLTFFIKIA